MQLDSLTLAEAMALAVNLEIKGRDFYLRAAEQTANPTGKRIFTSLAEEELIHLATFKAMVDKNPDLAQKARRLNESRPKPVLPVFDSATAAPRQAATADELAALRLAMKQEKEAAEFFTRTLALAPDDLSRHIFSFVLEQENYHYDLLQAEYDYIVGTGFWFDSPEFRMDGKM